MNEHLLMLLKAIICSSAVESVEQRDGRRSGGELGSWIGVLRGALSLNGLNSLNDAAIQRHDALILQFTLTAPRRGRGRGRLPWRTVVAASKGA